MPDSFFDEENLKKLFLEDPLEKFSAPFRHRGRKKKPVFWKLVVKLAALFLIVFIGAFILTNYTSMAKNLGYIWRTQFLKQGYPQIIPTNPPAATFNPTDAATIIIPKINASAPIWWNTPLDQVDNKLLEGVVHYYGTALPGQEGNVFITGHSSYYSWADTPYKDVFALLPKLKNGDDIYIQYKNRTFRYVINNTVVVSPSQVSVMEQNPGHNLTLMTCVPVGTNLNRLIISSTEAN